MTLLHVLVSIFISLLVSACAGQRSVATASTPSIPQTETECSARGGNWTMLGIPYPDKPKVCDLKAADAGKVCSDSSECQGACVAPDGVADGIEVTGTCSAYVSNFGHLRMVEHGKVELLDVD